MADSGDMVDAPPFELFSSPHLWALGAVVAGCVLFPAVARGRLEMPVRRTLAALLVVHIMFKTWLWIEVVGRSWNTMLPLHLCDIADLLCVLFLLRASQHLYELVYFWGLAGTLQALITPDLPWSFPHPTFVAFFFGHGIIIVVAVFATWRLEFRPRAMSIVRAFLALNLYALLITPINIALSANYLYLMAKPESATLIDHLGQWPWYILALEVLAFFSFVIYYLPFAAYDALWANGLLPRAWRRLTGTTAPAA